MAVHTTRAGFIKAFEARVKGYQNDSVKAFNFLTEGGKEDHDELTSGAIKTKTLRAMGHPFARTAAGPRGTSKAYRAKKGGRARVKELPINRQTGRLASSFYERKTKAGFDRRVRMGFSAYHARFVLRPGGTRKMIDRKFYSVGPSGTSGEIRKRFRIRLNVIKRLRGKG